MDAQELILTHLQDTSPLCVFVNEPIKGSFSQPPIIQIVNEGITGFWNQAPPSEPYLQFVNETLLAEEGDFEVKGAAIIQIINETLEALDMPATWQVYNLIQIVNEGLQAQEMNLPVLMTPIAAFANEGLDFRERNFRRTKGGTGGAKGKQFLNLDIRI